MVERRRLVLSVPALLASVCAGAHVPVKALTAQSLDAQSAETSMQAANTKAQQAAADVVNPGKYQHVRLAPGGITITSVAQILAPVVADEASGLKALSASGGNPGSAFGNINP